VTEPRVLTLLHDGKEFKYRVVDGVLQSQLYSGEWDFIWWWKREHVDALADLFANPTDQGVARV
jgi:hypothetical protein